MNQVYHIKFIQEYNGLVLYTIGGPSEISGKRFGSTEAKVRVELENDVLPRLNEGWVSAA